MPSLAISQNALVGDLVGMASPRLTARLLTIVGAFSAAKGPHSDFQCPTCGHLMMLVSGRIVEHLSAIREEPRRCSAPSRSTCRGQALHAASPATAIRLVASHV